MENSILNTNELFNLYFGSETIYTNTLLNLNYTEGVKAILHETESYWLIQLIASYQNHLVCEDFQVWFLERNLTLDENKFVLERKDSFKISCSNGNGKLLLSQFIEFSDFKFDQYTIWKIGNTLLLPREY